MKHSTLHRAEVGILRVATSPSCHLIVGACLCLAMLSCKTQQPASVVRDSVRVEYKLDSVYIYERDSVWVERYVKGDTVFLTRDNYRVKYKDKVVLQHDTISVSQTETVVEEVKYIPKFYKGCTIALWVIVVLVLLYIAWRVVKAIYLRK